MFARTRRRSLCTRHLRIPHPFRRLHPFRPPRLTHPPRHLRPDRVLGRSPPPRLHHPRRSTHVFLRSLQTLELAHPSGCSVFKQIATMLQPQSCSSDGPCIFYCGGDAPAVADVFRGGGEVLVPTHHGPAVASGSTRGGRATSPTNVEECHQMWADRETAMDQESDDGDRHPPESYDRLPVTGVQDIVNTTKEISGTWAGSPQRRGDTPHTYAVLCGN